QEVEILTDHLHEFDTALVKSWIRFLASLFGVKKKLFAQDKVLKVYDTCDLVLSTSGISFIDNFGIVKLYHYSKFLQIPVLNKVPVMKFTQSIGPFSSNYNKQMAKLLLPHLKLIMARGRHSAEHLAKLGITENVVSLPDIAVTLESYQTENTDAILHQYSDKEIIGVSPNEVCYRLDDKKMYLPSLFKLFKHIIETRPNAVILLIPHTIAENDKGKNDFWLCEQIAEYLKCPERVEIINTLELMPEETKFVISSCNYFIGSRFHALIASTSSNVPTLAIGWHWKYEEMMEWLGIEGNLIQYWDLDKIDIVERFEMIKEKELPKIERVASVIDKALSTSEYIRKVLNEY
ncbi:MAG: polysaccharide pyruvyl transferase family protein, partial [Candidatus Cloacimonetes bacterium]|nr:polysaccharide pyruvyl transferase family protein [Candidatus Cloacimonadota bacterium]